MPVNLTVNPIPAVTDQTTSISSGATFTVTPAGAPAGTTYTWTAPVYTGSVAGGSAQAAPQSSVSGTLTGTGTATYTVTPASGSCVGATFTVTVTVTTGCVPVTIGTQPADNSMCVTSGNASFTVIANGTAPFTYQWEYNNGGTWAAVVNGTPAGSAYTNANTATLGVAGITASGSYQYRVYITNCSGANNTTSNAANLTVNPLPAVTDQTTSISSGATFTVTPAGAPAGTTYTWTAPVYTGSVAGGSAQAAPQSSVSGTLTGTGTATYTVTPASGSCVGATFTVTVTVTTGCVPVTIGTQPVNNSFCATSGNASFTVTANGAAPFTWQWEYNNGGTWAIVVNGTPAGAAYTNANTATLGVAGITAAGSYQYRAYTTNCGGLNNATSDIVTLEVNPVANVTDQTTSILSGALFTVTPAGVPAGTTYTWTAPVYTGSVTGGSAQAAPQSSISGTLTGEGSATYTVTPASGTCIGTSFTVTVTVTTACVPVNIGSQPTDVSICGITGNATFTVVPNGTTPMIYQWEYNNGGTWAAVVNGTPAGAAYTNANTATLGIAGITSTGNYQYRVYITNCSGANNATSNAITLTFNAAPTVIITNPAPVCAPATVDITLASVTAGSTPGLTYTYWTDAAGTISYSTPTTATDGTYFIKGTTASDCYDIKPVIVTVNTIPSVPVVGTITQPTCALSTGSVVLSGLPASGTWTIDPGAITGSGTSTTISSLAAGTYSFTVTTAGGCTSAPSASIEINPVPGAPPAPTIGTITQPACALPTGSVILEGLPETGNWTINPGAVTNSGVSTTISGLAPGTYTFTVTNSAACTSPLSATVEIAEPPQFDFTVETSISTDGNYSIDCAGAESGYITVQALNASGTVDYLWSDGGTGNSRTNLAAGTYRVIMTDSDNCQADSSITLTEPALIELVFDVTEPTCPETPDGKIELTASGGVSSGDYAYLWSDNSTTDKLTDVPAGLYEVTVTDANMCSVTGSVELVSIQEMCLVINEVFSPNGDLINDYWNIGNTGLYPSMEITIYNRWGQSVWKSGVGYPVPWDGKNNGNDLPIDSYHYVIELHNGTKPFLGTVTIVR